MVMVILDFLTIPRSGQLGHSVVACDHDLQKILGAANVPLGLLDKT